VQLFLLPIAKNLDSFVPVRGTESKVNEKPSGATASLSRAYFSPPLLLAISLPWFYPLRKTEVKRPCPQGH
jgi:hypothetical protein